MKCRCDGVHDWDEDDCCCSTSSSCPSHQLYRTLHMANGIGQCIGRRAKSVLSILLKVTDNNNYISMLFAISPHSIGHFTWRPTTANSILGRPQPFPIPSTSPSWPSQRAESIHLPCIICAIDNAEPCRLAINYVENCKGFIFGQTLNKLQSLQLAELNSRQMSRPTAILPVHRLGYIAFSIN